MFGRAPETLGNNLLREFPVIQSGFDFTPGLTAQFGSLREVCASAVYSSRGGLKAVAADLDVSKSELSRMLNTDQDDPRKLDCDDVVGIIASTSDVRPIHWLIERFLQDPERRRAQAAEQLAVLLPAMLELAHQAGVSVPTKAKR